MNCCAGEVCCCWGDILRGFAYTGGSRENNSCMASRRPVKEHACQVAIVNKRSGETLTRVGVV